MFKCDRRTDAYMELIAQPVNNLLRHPCILALLVGIGGKKAEHLPVSQNEIGQIAEEDRRKTGDKQGSVTAQNLSKDSHAPAVYVAFTVRQGKQDYSKQEDARNLGERSEAGEESGQHTSTDTGTGCREYRDESKRQGNDIAMTL